MADYHMHIDDEKLAAVRAVLGTTSVDETVDGALDEVLKLIARRRALLAERGVDPGVMSDPEARRAAWS